MPGSGFTSANPFQGPPEVLWRNVTLDPQLQMARSTVAEEFAKEWKFQTAIFEGRTYGLNQLHYQAARKAKLASVLRHEPNTDKPW